MSRQKSHNWWKVVSSPFFETKKNAICVCLVMSSWKVNCTCIRLSVNITHAEANIDQSYIKASKLNSAGAKISISSLDILGDILIQAFMCQYEDNPRRTTFQPECIILYDLWRMLSHLVGYRDGIEKEPHLTITIRLAFCSKNRHPFPELEQLLASIYLILLKLPWRNAITQNRGATGADIDGLCR